MWKVIKPIPILLASVAFAAAPRPVITEIMYDPTSPESEDKQTEWVEIYNAGDAALNLQGYQLTSGTTADPHAARQKYVFRRDVLLPPHRYLVVGVGSASCYEGYGLPTFGVYCDEARYAWLTNGGDSVALRDAKKNVIDEVVYANESPWPITRNGGSIQFICPPGEDPQVANDQGKNWVASGASNSEEFKGHGRGTPGGPPKAGATTRPSSGDVATTKPSRPERSASAKKK
jgi:hypothetical protein